MNDLYPKWLAVLADQDQAMVQMLVLAVLIMLPVAAPYIARDAFDDDRWRKVADVFTRAWTLCVIVGFPVSVVVMAVMGAKS